jgi:hypothetical protein
MQAERDTDWHQGQVQGFLYERKDRALGGRDGNHVVRDCYETPEKQLVWQSGYDDGSRYKELNAEMRTQIRLRQIEIIAQRYAEIVNEKESR